MGQICDPCPDVQVKTYSEMRYDTAFNSQGCGMVFATHLSSSPLLKLGIDSTTSKQPVRILRNLGLPPAFRSDVKRLFFNGI